MKLASLSQDESVANLVASLANAESPPSRADVKAKWLYLVLAWVFECRDTLVDALGTVESIYSDFDYPEEVTRFVRYMPADEPALGNLEQNEARLLDRLKEYLDVEGKRFAQE